MAWDSTLLTQLVFILLYIIDVLIKVPNSVRNRFKNIKITTQSKYVKNILIAMLMAYILSFLMNYYSLMQYIFLGFLVNTILILTDITQKE